MLDVKFTALHAFCFYFLSNWQEFAKALFHYCPRFRVDKLYAHEEDALVHYICNRRDVFINLPTGYVKSVILL